jgi:hypothetical protein
LGAPLSLGILLHAVKRCIKQVFNSQGFTLVGSPAIKPSGCRGPFLLKLSSVRLHIPPAEANFVACWRSFLVSILNFNKMSRKIFWAQLLLVGLVLGVDQTCIWKDGSIARGYAPCTNSSASTGNCCSIGDVCTYNGICYGGVGLIYRGAYINEWGGDCLTYCDDGMMNFLPNSIYRESDTDIIVCSLR